MGSENGVVSVWGRNGERRGGWEEIRRQQKHGFPGVVGSTFHHKSFFIRHVDEISSLELNRGQGREVLRLPCRTLNKTGEWGRYLFFNRFGYTGGVFSMLLCVRCVPKYDILL